MFLAPVLALVAAVACASPLPAFYLRTEYLVDPLVVSTPSPRFSWLLPSVAGERGIVQSAYQLRVSSNSSGALFWDSGLVNSSAQNQIAYSGPTLAAASMYSWTVTWMDGSGAAAPASAPALFGTAPGDDSAWNAAGSQWIGCGAAPSANMLRLDFAAPPPTPGLTLQRATLYISGLGWHIPYLNGQRVSPRSVFEPAFTHLRLRVLYSGHDVTGLVNTAGGAANTLAAVLGHGWPGQFEPWAGGVGEPKWNGTGSVMATEQVQRRGGLAHLTQQQLEQRASQGLGHGTSGYERRLRAWLQLHWSDGSVTSVVTSAGSMEASAAATGGDPPSGWQCGRGPLLSDDIYAGCTYDARKELPGWAAPGFNASAWSAAVRIAEPGGAMSPALAQPVEVSNAIPPCALWESPTPGEWIFDFCQNFAGVVRLTLPGPTQPGTYITLRHAEAVMHPPYGAKDGSLYYGNLRSAEATDVYITRGDDSGETFEPMFTWHG